MKKFVFVAAIALFFATTLWAYSISYADEAGTVTKQSEPVLVEAEEPEDDISNPDVKWRERQIVESWYSHIDSYYDIDPSDAEVVLLNEKNDSLLKKRSDISWRAQYEKSIDSLFAVNSTAVTIAKNDFEVQQSLKKAIVRFGLADTFVPEYITRSSSNPVIKVVCLEGHAVVDRYRENVSLLRVFVNIKTGSVVTIETEPIGQLW